MMSRRDLALSLAPGVLAVTLAGCTNGTIDPQKVVDTIRTACAIAIPVATVAAIINAGVGMTAQAIVDLVCSAYKSSLASRNLGDAGLKTGEKIDFIVHVGGKDIPVEAVVQ